MTGGSTVSIETIQPVLPSYYNEPKKADNEYIGEKFELPKNRDI
jgi:hypothetical protein